MIDTIYFDNWNTLVQAPDLMRRGGSTERFHRYLESRGVDVPYGLFVEVYRPIARRHAQEADADGYRELDYEKRIENVFAELGLEAAEELAKGAWREYLDEWPRQTEFFPETPGILESLMGRYKLGVITNYMEGYTCQLVFDKLGYRELFDALVVSAEVGYRKPARVIFEQALRETGSRPENCVMVATPTRLTWSAPTTWACTACSSTYTATSRSTTETRPWPYLASGSSHAPWRRYCPSRPSPSPISVSLSDP